MCYIHTYVRYIKHIHMCPSVYCKRAVKLVALLRKMTCNLRHPMGLCHSVYPPRIRLIHMSYIHIYVRYLKHIHMCSSVYCKRAVKLVALLRKMTCNLRHPVGLCHSVYPPRIRLIHMSYIHIYVRYLKHIHMCSSVYGL